MNEPDHSIPPDTSKDERESPKPVSIEDWAKDERQQLKEDGKSSSPGPLNYRGVVRPKALPESRVPLVATLSAVIGGLNFVWCGGVISLARGEHLTWLGASAAYVFLIAIFLPPITSIMLAFWSLIIAPRPRPEQVITRAIIGSSFSLVYLVIMAWLLLDPRNRFHGPN